MIQINLHLKPSVHCKSLPAMLLSSRQPLSQISPRNLNIHLSTGRRRSPPCRRQRRWRYARSRTRLQSGWRTSAGSSRLRRLSAYLMRTCAWNTYPPPPTHTQPPPPPPCPCPFCGPFGCAGDSCPPLTLMRPPQLRCL